MRGGLRIAHVSDLHLGAAGGEDRRLAAELAWEQFHGWVTAERPDLVVVTGDLVVDDPDDHEDRVAAHRLIHGLDVPTLVVPGNHDVGDHEVREGLPADWHGALVSGERVRAWEELWGPGHRLVDVGDWAVIGLNSQLFGTELPAADTQWRWLTEHALPHAAGRRAAVFLHEGLHLRPEYGAEAPANGWMSVPRSASERLTRLLADAGVELIGSGHTHRFATWRIGGMQAVNAPSLVGPIPVRSSMDQPVGAPEPGWVELRLGPGPVEVRHLSRETREEAPLQPAPGAATAGNVAARSPR